MDEATSTELLRIEIGGGVVKVWHGRSARNLAEAETVLAAIDDALTRSGIHLLLFDSRDADRTPAPVQNRIWQWLTEHAELRRVATLMHSRELGKGVRVHGTGLGVRIRAFSSEDEARTWLLSSR
jgi:hypothetical protein